MSQQIEISQNPVILVSAESPACGSSSLAMALSIEIAKTTQEPHLLLVGSSIRKDFGVTSEAVLNTRQAEFSAYDPFAYDRPFYTDLPTDRVAVVEGKWRQK